jgi:hypothetical protein
MNSIRSTAFSASIFVLTTLGGVSLAACSIQTTVGNGNTGGSGGSTTATTSVTSSGSGGSSAGTLIFDAAGKDLNPWGIAVDATDAYITDGAAPNGKVLRVPLDGSPATELATDQYLPSAIAVDATDAYFMTPDAVMKVPVTGGPAVVASAAKDASFAGIVVDATNVYWTNYSNGGSTMFLPKTGGPATTVDTGGAYPSGIVVQGGSIYWALFGSDEIKTAPLAGGAATVFASGQNAPRSGLAADSTYLYWITEGDFPNHLVKAPLAGGPPVDVALSPSDASGPQSLLIDATHAYFIGASGFDCGLVKVELATGTVSNILLGGSIGCPMFLAADAANIYYTSRAGITKVAK